MTEIVDGNVVYNELSKRSNGGTELMCRRIASGVPQELLQGVQMIHSRPRELLPTHKRILVCHDLAEDPEVARLGDKSFRDQFKKIVFVSHWQAEQYRHRFGLLSEEYTVIHNAIEPIVAREGPRDGIVRLIYHTTPHRGLELLAAVFPTLRKQFPNVELDVYSSFAVYGWEQRDQQYQRLFDFLNQQDGVRSHGFRPNEEVREALTHADIFAFPSIWPETSCLAAIEAAAAGCLVVHSNLAALPETLMFDDRFAYDFTSVPVVHVDRFYAQLVRAVQSIIDNSPENQLLTWKRQTVYNQQYQWAGLARQRWIDLLENLDG